MYEIFRQLCQEKDVSTYKVCKDLGISQGTISNWKKGRNNLSNDVLKKIADYFGVTMDYLMCGNITWDPYSQEMYQKTKEKISKAVTDEGIDPQKHILIDKYYSEKEVQEMAEFLFTNPEYKLLFDASRNVKIEDIRKVAAMIKAFTEEDND